MTSAKNWDSMSDYPTGVIRDKPSNIEAIRRYYLQPEDRDTIGLTAAQETHRQQLVSAFTQLCARKSEEEVRVFLMKEYRISDSTAFRRIRESLELFGDVKKSSKEGRRYIVYELALHAYNIAEEERDADGMNKAVRNMILLLGLHKEDVETPDFERLQPSLVVTPISEELQQAIITVLKGGVINLNNISAEDIPYEKVEDEGAEPQSLPPAQRPHGRRKGL